MLRYIGTNRAQLVSEYALTFFIVITVMMAMGVYIKRALQGRMRDARMYAATTVENQWGKTVPVEYEPYTINSATQTSIDVNEQKGINGAFAIKDFSHDNSSTGVSIQLPPKDAD